MRNGDICAVLLALVLTATLAAGDARGSDESPRHNISDFGAQPDGTTPCTTPIQQAIERCAAEGGCVYFPSGTFLSGPVRLRSGVTILLDEGATWLGSRNRDDYTLSETSNSGGGRSKARALIEGYDLEHVTLRGGGTIDGNGDAFKQKDGYRPKVFYFEKCRDVRIEGVRLRNAGSWMQHYRFCEDLTISGIDVFNHASFNNDGLNVDSCRRVRIAGCRIDSDDDGIVLKSLSQQPCEDVDVRDCDVSSHCNAIKCGTESGGGFKRITVESCRVSSPPETKAIYGRDRGLAGIALEIVDGGCLEDVTVSDVSIRGVTVPIFLRLGNRARPYDNEQPTPGVGTFRRVKLSRIKAEGVSDVGCSITGLPGHPIEDVRLDDIQLEFEGGGTADLGHRDVPERPEAYPESTMFGTLPAYGFYCRHARDLAFHNIVLRTSKPDGRYAMVCDDVGNLVIDGCDAAAGGPAVLRFINVAGAQIKGCTTPEPAAALLRLEGAESSGIALAEQASQGFTTLVDKASEVPETVVTLP